MIQLRAFVILASAALFLFVTAQQTTPTAVQAYPADLRGTAAAQRETKDESVSFEARANSETEQQRPGRDIPGQNTVNLRGSINRRLKEDTTITLAIVFQTLIKAAYLAQGTRSGW